MLLVVLCVWTGVALCASNKTTVHTSDQNSLIKDDDYYYDDSDYNDDSNASKSTTTNTYPNDRTIATTTVTTTTTTASPLYNCPKKCRCQTVLDHHGSEYDDSTDVDDYNYDADDKNYDEELKHYRIDIDCSNAGISVLKNVFDDNFPFENIRKL